MISDIIALLEEFDAPCNSKNLAFYIDVNNWRAVEQECKELEKQKRLKKIPRFGWSIP